jgi:hypothetical protein
MKSPTVVARANMLTAWRNRLPVFSLTKNKREPQTFFPMGCWLGNLSTGEVIGILNQPDGKSIFYSLTGDPDASVILLQLQTYEGDYTIKGKTFQANYSYRDNKRYFQLNLQASHKSIDKISGIIIENGLLDSKSYSTTFQFNVTLQL